MEGALRILSSKTMELRPVTADSVETTEILITYVLGTEEVRTAIVSLVVVGIDTVPSKRTRALDHMASEKEEALIIAELITSTTSKKH
jgi:hypothetical protein